MGAPQRGARVSAYTTLRLSRGVAQAEFTSAEHKNNTQGSHAAGCAGTGMTDPFAVEQFDKLFIPRGWTVK